MSQRPLRPILLAVLLLPVATAVHAEADAAGSATATNLFPTQSWQPPPPPPSPPEPPRPPPLPFTYMGQLIEDGDIIVFLGRQQRTLLARAGDILDASYRLDTVTAQHAVFTYLPLAVQQTLLLRKTP